MTLTEKTKQIVILSTTAVLVATASVCTWVYRDALSRKCTQFKSNITQLFHHPVSDNNGGAEEPGTPAEEPGTPAEEPGTPAEEPGTPAEKPGTPDIELNPSSATPSSEDNSSSESEQEPSSDDESSSDEDFYVVRRGACNTRGAAAQFKKAIEQGSNALKNQKK